MYNRLATNADLLPRFAERTDDFRIRVYLTELTSMSDVRERNPSRLAVQHNVNLRTAGFTQCKKIDEARRAGEPLVDALIFGAHRHIDEDL